MNVMKRWIFFLLTTAWFVGATRADSVAATTGFASLRNPVWSSHDNLRDPSVLKTTNGYYLF